MIDIGKINNYLCRVLGFEFEDKGSLTETIRPVPSPVNHFFKGRFCELEGRSYALLQPMVEDIKLAMLIQRVRVAEEKLGCPCILILEAMDGMQRRQLIQNQICFIVPERQIFLPTLGTYLTEKRLNTMREIVSLSPAAQFLLLYHLQKESLENIAFSDLSVKLGYPTKTISVVASELKSAGLCETVQIQGRMKGLTFKYNGRELWDAALPMLSSPIQKIGYVEETDIQHGDFVKAYDDALSHYTDMGHTEQRCLAIERRSEIGNTLFNNIETTNYPESVRLEFWKYNPSKLSQDGFIDPLSMALCYKDDIDERIQGQIKRLIDRIL